VTGKDETQARPRAASRGAARGGVFGGKGDSRQIWRSPRRGDRPQERTCPSRAAGRRFPAGRHTQQKTLGNSRTRTRSKQCGFPQKQASAAAPIRCQCRRKNRVEFCGRAREENTGGFCANECQRFRPPLSGSAARLHHREDASPDRRGQARPYLDHSSEVAVCLVERGHFRGHFPGNRVILGRNRPRLRIANPPSSVRLRPEPLSFHRLFSPETTGDCGTFGAVLGGRLIAGRLRCRAAKGRSRRCTRAARGAACNRHPPGVAECTAAPASEGSTRHSEAE
jgi:hypothetical protein